MNDLVSLIKKRWYVLVAVLIFAGIIAIRQAGYQGPNGDVYIYWAVGRKFLAGEPLYVPVPGSQEFLYPPIAVLFCQMLALMPFPTAVAVFTVINFLAWLIVLWLTYRLLALYVPKMPLRAALLVGFVATIRYFWHNILWVNVNELIAILGVGGLYAYLRGRHWLGLGLLSLAMWIKVMPLLLILVLFIRRPVQTGVAVLGYTVLFGLILLGFRGPAQGIQDYFDYWTVTFRPFFLGGKVFTDWIAFGVSPTLSKLLTEHVDINGIHYNIASWPPAVVNKISLVIRLLIIGLTYRFVWLTRQRTQLPLLAILLAFLTMLLVSGVSWEGHHVTLLPVIAGLYVLLTEGGNLTLRRWLAGVTIVVGLLTSDLLGARLADYLQAYSLITYNVLFLYVIAVWLAERELKTGARLTASALSAGYINPNAAQRL